MLNTDLSPQVPSIRLLMVDDEPAILTSLKRLLFDFECEIRTAGSGKEALEMLKSAEADIIISDMRMAGMDGVEFLTEVANRWPDTERILLTGYADLESTIGAINKGRINFYLEKPWDDERLRRIVRKGIEISKAKYRASQLELQVQAQNERLQELNDSLEQQVLERTRELNDSNLKLQESLSLINKNYQNTLQLFSSLIEQRLGKCIVSRSGLTSILKSLAVAFKLSEDESRNLVYAGILRNLGKIGFPDEIIKTPYGDLSVEQQRQYKSHISIAEGMMCCLPPLRKASTVLAQRQERFDGSGYPEELQGEDISLSGRILAVVADFVSLCQGLSSGYEYSLEQAMEKIEQGAGKLYDPAVVAQFKLAWPELAPHFSHAADSCVGLDEIKPGMTLARDLVAANGSVLLAEGYVLDEEILVKLKDLEQKMQEKLEFAVHSEQV